MLPALPAACLLLGACSAVDTPRPPDHDPSVAWARSLGSVTTDDGLVRYDLLRQDPAPLRDFVGWIAAHGPETDGFRLLDDDRRLAWHLNAYNALVLWSVVQADPALRSVLDLPGFFWWREFAVDGERVSLYNYERRDILPTYQEPLAHAALNWGARSCPPLRAELYRAGDVQEQLQNQMRRWVATPDPKRTAVYWDEQSVEFVFSPIFDRHGDDFRRWAGAETPCDAVRPYGNVALRARLSAHKGCPHRFYEVDGSLNTAS